jgi:predicted ATPase
MPIDRIHIKNFKSIRDSGEIQILPVNILIGANGVGKSNFIGFFKLLNSIYKQQLKKYVADSGYENQILHFGRRKSKDLGGSIVFRPDDGNTNNRYDFKLVPQSNGSGLYFEEDVGGYNHFWNGYNEKWDFKNFGGSGLGESELRNHGSERAKFLCEYFEEFRVYHFHDTSPSSALKNVAKTQDNDKLREDGSNLASYLYRIQSTHPKHFKLIEHTIRSVAPFFDRFNLKPDPQNPEMIFLSWLERGSDEYFNAHNLSDGSLRFVALTTLLLQPDLPRTVIIDEPELGLHPYAVHKLAEMIKKASTSAQVIISTQSVTLLDQFTIKNIIVVDRENEQSVFKRQDEESLSQWLEDYTLGDIWGKNVIGGTP